MPKIGPGGPTYVSKRGRIWQFYMEVPKHYRSVESRTQIKFSLKTTEYNLALEKAQLAHKQLVSMWEASLAGSSGDTAEEYTQLVEHCQALGFRYIPLAEMSDEEMLRRAHAVNLTQASDETTLAVFGLVEWSIPYKRALAMLAEIVGPKPIVELNRHDALALHKDLTGKIAAGDIKTNTANRMMSCLSSMHETYKRHYQLDLPTVFRGLHITETDAHVREPVPEEWIKMLLEPGKLDGLNLECQAMLKVVINTGIRPSELILAQPHHICLDHNIPHLQIRAEGREIKTIDSERDVPLLGMALEAMRVFPNGLEHYREKPSGCLPNTNKFLKKHDLVPLDKSGKHMTVYCFRHSFKDRLTSQELPDTITKAVMGHRVEGQRYGAGPSLEHLARVLEPISF